MGRTKVLARTKVPATATVPLVDLPELLTPEEAAGFLRISRNHMYELVKTGAVPSLKFGRLIRIPKSSLIGGGR